MAKESKDANAIILAEYLDYWLPKSEPGNEMKVLRSSLDISIELDDMAPGLTIQDVTDEMVRRGYLIRCDSGRPRWVMWGPSQEEEDKPQEEDE